MLGRKKNNVNVLKNVCISFSSVALYCIVVSFSKQKEGNACFYEVSWKLVYSEMSFL